MMTNLQAEGFVEVKSKFDAEFRRFSLDRSKHQTFDDFYQLLEDLHILSESKVPFRISYIDPKDNDLLPINNTDNYLRALKNARPLLRLVIQRQGEYEESVYYGRASGKSTSLITSMLGTPKQSKSKSIIAISQPSEFRQVSAIIDVDVVPETCRRVRLLKHGSDRPLGFYIRDGTSVRVTPQGLEKVPGIFISRLVPGGLAESTGLLAVNDEVLEVNGIEVAGKSLDQVTDMMVANSSNLIITVKPANQRTLMPRRGSFSRTSNMSHGSLLSKSSTQSAGTAGTGSDDHEDEDEIRDLTNVAASGHHMESLDSRASYSTASLNSKKQVLHL
jgi:partitioning defective protein 6